MLRQYKSSMINVLRNCIYPDKVSIIHGFAMSVYALLIDFNKIKKKNPAKWFSKTSSFYRIAKVFVECWLPACQRRPAYYKCLYLFIDSSWVSAIHKPHCTFICIPLIKHPQSCYHSFVICTRNNSWCTKRIDIAI